MLKQLLFKSLEGCRISKEEALFLYKEAPLNELLLTASKIKELRFGKNVFYIQNVHIEPTNYCIYECKFCSFHKKPNEEHFWEYQLEDIIKFLKQLPPSIKEIHITGGVHPHRDLFWYIELIKIIRVLYPQAHIKAFTAIEIHYMTKKANVSLTEGLLMLKQAGLSALAGGGAEILIDNIRSTLCPEKGKSKTWIDVHTQAHHLGIVSNATMLYGHIENIEHRIEHMDIIRSIQDKTHGFNCFIPLKFRKQHNFLSHVEELPFIEDMRLFAISRIFFDNIPHLKAYWPMIGRDKAALLLHAGADDIDGTIYNSTKIYSMAGSEEQQPSITVEELQNLIKKELYIPVERDLFYNII